MGDDDGGVLAFRRADAAPDKAGTGQRVKIGGHFHRCRLDADYGLLYACGFHKLEVWDLVG